MTNNKLERAARYYVQQEVRGMVDTAIHAGDMERAFAAGAKWFEEQLNSTPEVEPKQKRKDDETDENFFRFFKSKCEYNKGNCCIKHGGKIACCIQNCHSFKEWL